MRYNLTNPECIHGWHLGLDTDGDPIFYFCNETDPMVCTCGHGRTEHMTSEDRDLCWGHTPQGGACLCRWLNLVRRLA